MRERLRLSLALVLVMGVCALSGTARAQATRTVTGIVVDNEGGAGITGASVQVKDSATVTTQTVAGGSFTLAKVPVGETTLQVAAEGYLPLDVPVKAGRGATVVAVYLSKMKAAETPTRIVTGLVRDQATGAPLAGASVKVQGTEIGAVADADGLFVLPGVAQADVVLEVSAADHSAAVVTLPASEGTAKVQLASTAAAPPPDETAPPATGRAIRGKITEAQSGDPIPGATVQIIGTEILAITDENGEYVLEGAPLTDALLEIQSGGYEAKRITAPATATQASAVLSFSTAEEIYIVGRAPVIVKSNSAHGASVVNDQDLNRVSAQTLDQAMVGKISGANIQSNSGAPGGGTQLRLRGISTITGQASPLYVVDGVILSNVAISPGTNAITAATAGGNPSAQDNPVNRIADLNPNDIENVEVLKGASAAALYGSKAANGVVIITTKRGRAGQNTLAVTQRFGFATLSNTLGARKFDNIEEVRSVFGSNPELEAAFNASGGKTFDLEKQMTQTKLASETIVSASGGSENGNYNGSVLVKDEPGILIGTYYEKQSGRLTVGYDFGKRLKLSMMGNLIHTTSSRGLTNNDNTGTSYYVVLSKTPNFLDLREKNGVFPANPALPSRANNLQTLDLLENKEDVWRFIGATNANLKVWGNATNAVSLQGTFGVDRFQQKNSLLSPRELIFEPILDGQFGTLIDGSTTNLNANVGVGALWSLTPSSKKFRSALTGGLTYEYVDQFGTFVIAENLAVGTSNVDSASSIRIQENRLRSKDQGVYLQEEVALLDDKLSLLAGILGERSSLNGDSDKFYLFPKAAVVYSLPVPEKLFETVRVRGAYGEAGNRPNYGQKFEVLDATNNYDGNSTYQLDPDVGSLDIEPERQREFELGVDGALANQKLAVELTVYQRTISNLLLRRALPDSSGRNTEFLNGGSLRNRGVEAALQVSPLPEGAFDWVSRATFTLNRSNVTDLPENIGQFDDPNSGFGSGLGVYRIQEGKSATQIVAGSAADPLYLGDGEPDFRVGWSNNFTWKQFGLTSLLDWQQGSRIVNLTRLLYDDNGLAPDPEAALERLTADDFPAPYVEDATFLKLREVSLYYDLPEKVAKQIGPLSSLRVTLSGRNLLTFTGYSGLDPEVSNFGGQSIGRNFDVAPYPPSRSFWFSVDAGF